MAHSLLQENQELIKMHLARKDEEKESNRQELHSLRHQVMDIGKHVTTHKQVNEQLRQQNNVLLDSLRQEKERNEELQQKMMVVISFQQENQKIINMHLARKDEDKERTRQEFDYLRQRIEETRKEHIHQQGVLRQEKERNKELLEENSRLQTMIRDGTLQKENDKQRDSLRKENENLLDSLRQEKERNEELQQKMKVVISFQQENQKIINMHLARKDKDKERTRQEFDYLRQRIEETRKEHIHQQGVLRQEKERNKELLEENSRLQAMIRDGKLQKKNDKQRDSLRKENENLLDLLRQEKERNKELRGENDKLGETLRQEKERNEELRGENDQLRGSLQEREENLHQFLIANKEKDEWNRQQITSLRQELQNHLDKESEEELIYEELDSLRQVVDKLGDSLRQEKERNQGLQGDNDKLGDSLRLEKERNEELRGENDQLGDSLRQEKERNQGLQGENDKLGDSLRLEKERNEELRGVNDQLRGSLQEREENLQQFLIANKEKDEWNRQQITSLRQELQNHLDKESEEELIYEELDSLRQVVDKLGDSLRQEKERNQGLRGDNDKLGDSLRLEKERNEELRGENNQLGDSLRQEKERNQGLRGENDQLGDSLRQEKERNQGLRGENDQLGDSLRQEKERNQGLQGENDKLGDSLRLEKERNEELRGENDQLRGSLQEREENLQQFLIANKEKDEWNHQQITSLRQELQNHLDKESEEELIYEELDSLRQVVDKLSRHLHENEESLREEREENDKLRQSLSLLEQGNDCEADDSVQKERETNEKLRQEIEKLYESEQRKSEEINALTSQVKSLSKHYKRLQKHNSQLLHFINLIDES
ncbi:uncharacterized protein [Panulirus ornatus]|uniref:uncharacterized protein n=1 Tax=Panulirus ornatus TaxID=150431 RepID=UPI003A842312